MTLSYKLRGSLVGLVYVQLNIQCRQQQVAKEKKSCSRHTINFRPNWTYFTWYGVAGSEKYPVHPTYKNRRVIILSVDVGTIESTQLRRVGTPRAGCVSTIEFFSVC